MLLRASAASLVLWLVAGAVTTWWLTHPAWYRRGSSPPDPERVTFSTRDGLTLVGTHHRGAGDGACVVLLHGIGGTRHQLADRVAWLAEEGHDALSLDARGHGESQGGFIMAGWDATPDLVAAVTLLEAQRPGCPIVVWGYSMGAATALFAAHELDRRVAGYLLEAPYARLGPAIESRVQRRLVEPFASAAYLDLWLYGHALPAHFDAINPIERVADIPAGVPTVFVSGDADRRAPLSDVEEMVARRPGTALLVLQGATHDRAFATHRETYAPGARRLISAVLSSVRSDTQRSLGWFLVTNESLEDVLSRRCCTPSLSTYAWPSASA